MTKIRKYFTFINLKDIIDLIITELVIDKCDSPFL